MTDYPDWQNPAANALQIAAAGVPLLTHSQRLYQQAVPNVGPAATTSTGTLAVTQPGYEIFVTAAFAGAPANPFCRVQLTWSDSTSGGLVATNTYYMPGSTGGPGILIRGNGPTRGDRLTVGVTNLDAAQQCTITTTVLVNSRVYPADIWRLAPASLTGAAVNGFTLPNFPADESCLGLVSGASVAAGATSQWLMGVGAGSQVSLVIEASGPLPANARFRGYALPVSVYGAVPPLLAYDTLNLDEQFTFPAPHGPWLLVAGNIASSGAMTVNFAAFTGT